MRTALVFSDVALSSARPQGRPLRHSRDAEIAQTQRLARSASQLLGIRFDGHLEHDGRGRPVWQEDIVGSVSHSKNTHAVAVASRATLHGVGIDVEEAAAVGEELSELVLTPRERAAHSMLGQVAPGVPWLSIAFSVKEAVFKAVSVVHDRGLEFEDVELQLDPKLTSFRSAVSKGGALQFLSGRFWITDGQVAAVACWRKGDDGR